MSLESIIPVERIKFDEPMKNHTTFCIGGPADILVAPESVPEITGVIQWAKDRDLPYMVIGGGSNLLVRDGGIRGLVVKLDSNFAQVTVDEFIVRAQSGIRVSQLAKTVAEQGLADLEFAEGIPGSLGGAVYMNAGAYGGEFSQVVSKVTALNEFGEIRVMDKSEIEFGYRSSSFQKNGYIVLEVELALNRKEPQLVKERMRKLSLQRKSKQPLEFPSAGSVFKRPPGRFVGPMIDELGLKGYRVGDAEISSKHAGFIINRGQATAQDVLMLVSFIKQRVKDEYGVDLETEFLVIGED